MVLRRYWLSILLALILGFMLNGTAIAQSQLSTSIQASPKTKKSRLQGSWNLSLENSRFEDSSNQKNLTEFVVGMDLKYQALEMLVFNLAPLFIYTNGFTQTVDQTASSASTWAVEEASATLEPHTSTRLSAGALNQQTDHPSLLMGKITFPAVRLKLQTDDQLMFSAGLVGESAIPTSNSLSTETKEFEKTPSFNSGSVFMKLQKTLIEGTARAGLYEFQNLPLSVSTRSGLYGNSTNPASGTDREFKYHYKGVFADLELKSQITRSIALKTRGQWAKNDQAPAEYNQGYSTKTTVDLNLGRNWMVSPFYTYFHIEPDAVVALYNSSSLNANRVGYKTGLEIAFQKTIKLSVSGGERDVVFESPFQQREKTMYVTLETFDVAI